MRIISMARLKEFWSKYPCVENPLKTWANVVKPPRMVESE